MPGTGAPRRTAPVTAPSASVACSAAEPASPNSVPKLAGQLATTGWFTGAPQTEGGVAPLRGAGAPFAKSAPFWSVSVQPPARRRAAVVLERLGAVGPAPSKAEAAVPKPTRSRTDGFDRQSAEVPQVRSVVLVTSATFPEVAAMAMLPIASGVGSGCVPPAPCDSCTSRYCPGASVVAGRFVRCQVVPPAAAYRTDQPVTSTGVLPRLNTSMKSLVRVAPALPPPP